MHACEKLVANDITFIGITFKIIQSKKSWKTGTLNF